MEGVARLMYKEEWTSKRKAKKKQAEDLKKLSGQMHDSQGD